MILGIPTRGDVFAVDWIMVAKGKELLKSANQ